MINPNPSTTPLRIQRLVPFLLLSVVCFHFGVASVMADDVPIWDPNTGVGYNTAGIDNVDEIIVPADNDSYYLNQWVNFRCSRSFDFDKLIVGGSTSYPPDAMTDDPAYPYWNCYFGDFPFGESGTSVYWWAPSWPAEVYIAVGEADLPSPIPPPPQTSGYRDDGDSWVDGRTIFAVGVEAIQYYEDGTWVNNWNGDTIYVLKDTQVQFRAVKAPYQAPDWPSGKPVWSGSAGASGTGETKTVTFSTKSNSLTDYKTVTLECGNIVTIKVIVYTLTGILTPDSQFAGRSQTDYGIEETISLSYSTDPSGIPNLYLEWIKTSGVGVIIVPNGKYDAQDADGDVTLKLRHTSGPSAGLGPTYFRHVCKPSGTRMTRLSSSVAHWPGYASAGIALCYWINPSNVSFSNLRFREGGCSPINVTGFFEKCEPYENFMNKYPNGTIIRDHPIGNIYPIIVVDNQGSMVYSVDLACTGAANPYAAGQSSHMTWPIPTIYYPDTNNLNVFGNSCNQTSSFTPIGGAMIEKDAAPSGSRELNDPYSDFF